VEVLTSKLSQLEQFQRTFRVVPASEIRDEGITSAREAAKAFGVALVVTGSVQRAGDRVRLTINLVDPVRVRQLKTKSIDTAAWFSKHANCWE
jgi:TolB-like protein